MKTKVLKHGATALMAVIAIACADKTPSPEPAPEKKVVPAAEKTPTKKTEINCDQTARRAEALSSGLKLLGGVNLKESTPIAKINAAPETFTGKTLQVEGTIVSLCPARRCWALLTDGEGNELRLKVTDGKIDFRDEVKPGQYAVADGVYTPTGHHGAQVFVQDHGALIAPSICPPK